MKQGTFAYCGIHVVHAVMPLCYYDVCIALVVLLFVSYTIILV